MEINITEEKDNPLLKRLELKAIVGFSGPTPSRKEIRKELAAKKEVNSELIIIDAINQQFGKNEVKVIAKIYKDAESMKIEPSYKSKRGEPKEAKTEEAKPAAEKPKEEKPAKK